MEGGTVAIKPQPGRVVFMDTGFAQLMDGWMDGRMGQ